MLVQLILLVIGFVVLIKGADIFVEGASAVAKHLNVPDILIGLTIVAFGTSAPEAAVSIKAVLNQNSDMVLGNIVGSNILNILLILGIAAFIAPITVQNNTIKKEIPFSLLASILMSVLLLDHWWNNDVKDMISRQDGSVILIFFAIFIYYLISLAKSGEAEQVTPAYSLPKAILFSALSLVAIIVGGNLVVDSASEIAKSVGVSDKFIALTIVALGTSLPELATSIIAAKKGKQDLVLGNIIGSNIFNICFVVGFSSAFINNVIPSSPMGVDLFVMVASTFLLFIFAFTGKKISKSEGITFLALFIVYYGYLIIGQLNG